MKNDGNSPICAACESCGKTRRLYFDGRCATCHERRIFGDVRLTEGSDRT